MAVATRQVRVARLERPRDWMLYFREIVLDGTRVSIIDGHTETRSDVTTRFERFSDRLASSTLAEERFEFEIRAAQGDYPSLQRLTREAHDDDALGRFTAHEALERSLLERDSPEAARVYTDWLLTHGDPRAELAVLHQRGETGLARSWLVANAAALFGGLDVRLNREVHELRWSHGFLKGVSVALRNTEPHAAPATILAQLLALPVSRFVTSLGLEDVGAEGLHAVLASPRAAQLQHLKVRERDAEAVLALATATLPALTHLSLYTHGLEAVVEALAPSAALRTLRSLALVTGFPPRELPAVLLAHAEAFQHLQSLRVTLSATDRRLRVLKERIPALFVDDGWLG